MASIADKFEEDLNRYVNTCVQVDRGISQVSMMADIIQQRIPAARGSGWGRDACRARLPTERDQEARSKEVKGEVRRPLAWGLPSL